MLWNFVLIAKTVLWFTGNLQFDPAPNLAFLAYASLPVLTERLRKRPWPGPLARAHWFVGTLLLIALVWHDSYFPPVSALLEFVGNETTRPTLAYTGSFLLGLWDTAKFAALALILLFCRAARKRDWNSSVIVLAAVLIPSAKAMLDRNQPAADPADQYYAEESRRPAIRFEAPGTKAKPFDVIVIQVCSMAWDDLKTVGQENHAFLSQFDLLFTRFNTITSYSTPAALRLLRSNCAPGNHQSLYQPASDECSLMQQLRQAGFQTETLFNNEGKLAASMAGQLRTLAKADAPRALEGLEPESTTFDDSRIFNNLQVLNRWWSSRVASGAPRSALFYNTVSLHGGSHDHGDHDWWKRSRPELYQKSLARLFGELDTFFRTVESSGRDALVILVSEHGAALQGSAVQAPDLRDIPMPKITTVPMAVKFLRKDAPARAQRRVDEWVTYPAVARVIQESLSNDSPAVPDLTAEDFIRTIPRTRFFAENENAATAILNDKLFYRGSDRDWKPLPKDQLP